MRRTVASDPSSTVSKLKQPVLSLPGSATTASQLLKAKALVSSSTCITTGDTTSLI